jgi:hypothetical protein
MHVSSCFYVCVVILKFEPSSTVRHLRENGCRKREAKSGTRPERRRPRNKPRGLRDMVAHNAKKEKEQSTKIKRAATDLFDASWYIVFTYGFEKCSRRSIRHGNMAGDN